MKITFTAIDPQYLDPECRLDMHNQYYLLALRGNDLITWDIEKLEPDLQAYLNNLLKDFRPEYEVGYVTTSTAKDILKLTLDNDYRLAEACKIFTVASGGYVNVVLWCKA